MKKILKIQRLIGRKIYNLFIILKKFCFQIINRNYSVNISGNSRPINH